MMRALLYGATLLALAGGCAAPTNDERTPTARQQANRITAEEIQGGPQTSAYDLVRGLRSQWLRPRGPGSPIMVYLDGVRVGGVEELRRFSVADISELEFMDPIDAMSRYGMGHENGVIHLVSRRRYEPAPQA